MLTSFARLVPASWTERSLRRNVVLNWGATLVASAVSLLLTPILVTTLDKENYGVWTFLNGLTQYSNLLYLGLGAAFLKRMSEAWGRGDHAEQTRLLGIAWTLYFGIGVVCLTVAVALSPFVPRLLATPLSSDTLSAATLTMALLGVRLMVMFVNSAFTAFLTALGRWDLVSTVVIASMLARALGVVWAMRQPTPIVWLAVVTALEAVLQWPAFVGLCRLVAPAVRLRPVVPTRDELRGLYGFGVQAFAVQVSILIVSYTDTALIGVILGAAAVTLYTLPLQLVEHSRVLVGGITHSLLPELAATRARGETARLTSLFLVASRTSVALSTFINVHLVLLGPAFLALWVGHEIADGSLRILLCLAVAATAAAISTQVMTPFYQAMDLLPRLTRIVLAEAAVNFALSVWFARVFGVWGVALATVIPAVGVTLFLSPRHIVRALGMNMRAFAVHAGTPAVALGGACAAVQWLLSQWIGADTYGLLVLRVVVSAVVAVPVGLATLPRDLWLPLLQRLFPQ